MGGGMDILVFGLSDAKLLTEPFNSGRYSNGPVPILKHISEVISEGGPFLGSGGRANFWNLEKRARFGRLDEEVASAF